MGGWGSDLFGTGVWVERLGVKPMVTRGYVGFKPRDCVRCFWHKMGTPYAKTGRNELRVIFAIQAHERPKSLIR